MFRGSCPFHQDCVEGLSSSISISERLSIDRLSLASLHDDDPVSISKEQSSST